MDIFRDFVYFGLDETLHELISILKELIWRKDLLKSGSILWLVFRNEDANH